MAPDLNSLSPLAINISTIPPTATMASNTNEQSAAHIRDGSPSPSPRSRSRSASVSLQAAATLNAGLQRGDSVSRTHLSNFLFLNIVELTQYSCPRTRKRLYPTPAASPPQLGTASLSGSHESSDGRSECPSTRRNDSRQSQPQFGQWSLSNSEPTPYFCLSPALILWGATALSRAQPGRDPPGARERARIPGESASHRNPSATAAGATPAIVGRQ